MFLFCFVLFCSCGGFELLGVSYIDEVTKDPPSDTSIADWLAANICLE